MFGWFRKKRRPQQNPAWITWLMIGFLAYAILINHGENASIPTKDEVKTNISEATDAVINTEPFKNKLLPQAVEKLSVQDTLSTDGAPATCGQKATIRYTIFKTDGSIAQAEKTQTLRIGEGNARAFEEGITGMTKGGKRTITVPIPAGYGLSDIPPNDPVRLEVTLTDLTPTLPPIGGYHILGDILEAPDSYRCGNAVKVKLVMWNMEGKKIYETKDPISFILGNSDVFFGLEQGMLGMRPKNTRTLVVPPEFQNTLNGNPPLMQFPLPKKQTVLVDIAAIP